MLFDIDFGMLMCYEFFVEEFYIEEVEIGEEVFVFGNFDFDFSVYLVESILFVVLLSVLYDFVCKGLC